MLYMLSNSVFSRCQGWLSTIRSLPAKEKWTRQWTGQWTGQYTGQWTGQWTGQ